MSDKVEKEKMYNYAMRALSSLCFRFSKKQAFTECLKLLYDLEFFILAFRPFQIVAPQYERQF